MAASVLGAALLVSGIGWAVRDRSAQWTERVTRTRTQIELILADVDRSIQEQKWPEVLIEARRAEAVLAGGESDQLTAERVRELLKDLEFIERLEQIRMQPATWIQSSFDDAGARGETVLGTFLLAIWGTWVAGD